MKKFIISLNFISSTPVRLKVFQKKGFSVSANPFYMFVLGIRSFLQKHKNKTARVSFVMIPVRRKFLTLLRAPYRYKLARDQIFFSRYRINVKIIFLANDNKLSVDDGDMFFFLKKFTSFLSVFNTNLCTLHSAQLTFFCKSTNFYYKI